MGLDVPRRGVHVGWAEGEGGHSAQRRDGHPPHNKSMASLPETLPFLFQISHRLNYSMADILFNFYSKFLPVVLTLAKRYIPN